MEAVDGDYDDEYEPYHCDGTSGEDCTACVNGCCGYDDGHCYHPSTDDWADEDEADCVHCGCCGCLGCEYASVA